MRQRVLSWASTAAFLPVFGSVMLGFDAAQRLARVFGQRPQEHVAGALQWALVRTFAICGTRLVVERSPAVQRRGSYVIVANHQSMFDIAILGALFYWNFPKYVSKRSLGRGIPSVSYNLRRGGHVLIDRGDAAGAIAAIRDLGERVAAGRCSGMIFPEGTRARAGALGPFKPAGTLALLEAAPETPVVPVAIDESWRLLERNFLPVPWGTRVRVRIAAPIARRPGDDPHAVLALVRDEIEATLGEWRSGRLHADAA